MSVSLQPPWTVACQAPPSMRCSRQEHWSGLHTCMLSQWHFFPFSPNGVTGQLSVTVESASIVPPGVTQFPSLPVAMTAHPARLRGTCCGACAPAPPAASPSHQGCSGEGRQSLQWPLLRADVELSPQEFHPGTTPGSGEKEVFVHEDLPKHDGMPRNWGSSPEEARVQLTEGTAREC